MTPPLPPDEAGRLEEATRISAELTSLLEITDSALSTLDLDTLLTVMLDRLVRVMRADAGAILLEERGQLEVRASAGFETPAGRPPSIPAGAGVGGRIFATRQPLHIADVQHDPQVTGSFLAEQGIISMLGVPLCTRDRLVGVLHVDWRQHHPANVNDLHVLQTAAERCAAAIVNAQLFAELRAANAGAERARERLTLALGAADLGVWDWDVVAGTVVWDEANERIFGLPAGGFDGRLETFAGLVHPDDLPGLRAAISAALEGAPYGPTFRIVRPDGVTRWLSAYGSFQRSPEGVPLRLLGVTEDVTEERQHAEERELLLTREHEARSHAERAEQRIVSILERVTDAFVALDTNWNYTYVSRKAAEIFGRTPENLVGKHIWTEFPEGIGQPFYHAYHRAAAEQMAVSFEEYYPPYQRWFENRIYPAPDGLSIFFSDVTERKVADERLKATNEQLRALSARIQTVREEEAVRIAREIHDELGQLLTALRMDVGWIRKGVAALATAGTASLLARADGMAELTERTIRTVQRISEELRPAALDQLGLEAALAAQLIELKERAGVIGLLISSLGERRLSDPIETGVFRIVQGLLTNIARHAGATSVTVELLLEGDASETLIVRVSDDGRGIQPNEVVAPRSLGLVGIRERALLLGGTAEFRGEAGEGTVVRIAIPCAEGGLMTAILLADDHAIIRRGLKEMLQEALPKVRIEEADTAAAVAEAVRAGEWDLLVLDLSLPGRSGLDVLKDVKASHPKLPVLILSMYPEEQFAMRALRAGAAGYIAKHAPPEELLTAVRKALAGGRYVSASLAERLASEMGGGGNKEPHELLSDRELQVLLLIASGLSLTAIGESLSVSVQTVSTYRTRLLEKMGMTTNAELTKYVRLHGLS